MTTSKPRFSITLEEEVFDKLDNFRFQNRFQSRSQAAAELIRIGLNALENEAAREAQENPGTDTEADV